MTTTTSNGPTGPTIVRRRAAAYRATAKATPPPNREFEGTHRVRYDRVDTEGAASLRRAEPMHHLGVGAAHEKKRVILLIDAHTVTVVHLETGELLATNRIDPTRSYWRNQKREPGR